MVVCEEWDSKNKNCKLGKLCVTQGQRIKPKYEVEEGGEQVSEKEIPKLKKGEKPK